MVLGAFSGCSIKPQAQNPKLNSKSWSGLSGVLQIIIAEMWKQILLIVAVGVVYAESQGETSLKLQRLITSYIRGRWSKETPSTPRKQPLRIYVCSMQA